MNWPEPYTKDSEYLPVATITVCGVYSDPTGMWNLGPTCSRMVGSPSPHFLRFASVTRVGSNSTVWMSSLQGSE